jgi:type I restriction enzyme S subunit
MNKYPEYKDSGFEGIDKIPSHWEIRKTKRLFSEINIRNRDQEFFENQLLSVPEYYGIALRREKIKVDDILNRADSLDEYKKVAIGDLVINIMLAWKKGLGVSSYSGIVSPSYSVFRLLSDGNSKYFHYLYRIDFYGDYFKRYSKGIIDSRLRMYPEEFFKTETLMPPTNDEQTAIANFLDLKTQQIDDLIERKKLLIDLLKEERTAVINQAVTKGLDPNVTMKNSGIEWLGEIPEHWEVKKIKHIAFLKSGDGIKTEQIKDSGNYKVYGGNGVRGYFSNYTHEGEYILIGRQGALCGNIHIATGMFWASEHAVVVDVFNTYNLLWAKGLLESMNLNQYSVSAAQPGLSVDRVKNLQIPVPPKKEQIAIGNFINYTEDSNLEAIKTIEKETVLLQEYKTSIINEAVTGKIDVRDYQISHATE